MPKPVATSFRLEQDLLDRLDKLAEFLRRSMNLPRMTRSWALSYLILQTLEENGVPTWEAVKMVDPEEFFEEKEEEPDTKALPSD
jgi:predicted transcriptional regulator